VDGGAATLLHKLAVPYAGFEEAAATDVKPDFAIVAPKLPEEGDGSWLVLGDAKDYERVRSRVDDARLLKGFLQVAVGAESCSVWSLLPASMDVHPSGVLAVPRNAFLQPEAIVEPVADHRAEARMRIAARETEAQNLHVREDEPLADFVAHLEATFDPESCPTCSLFYYCRDQLRQSPSPGDLLIALGVTDQYRPALVRLIDGTGDGSPAPASVIANVTATLTGHGQWTGQRRVDPVGQPGTVNVVIAKSDAAALGIHGMATQRVTFAGRQPWKSHVFEDPQSAETRRHVLRILGDDLSAAMIEMRHVDPDSPPPVHLAVPDKTTADVLVSIADHAAGLELSRLGWRRDKQMGRPALTFNGEPATIPPKLREADRTAVSFLLEEDRARALKVRSPIVDVRAALARHLVAGGPVVSALRLDYLVGWCDPALKVDAIALEDAIEKSDHAPGAKLTNKMSDQIHKALVGTAPRKDRTRAADPDAYRRLVLGELAYKAECLKRALDALERVPDSNLREAYRAIEGGAQEMWRRRLRLHASDLVRFGRVYPSWRDSQVPAIESDARCHDQLLALLHPEAANELATAAGTRQVSAATVVAVSPLVLDLHSRGIRRASRIVLLHINGEPCVEQPFVTVKAQKGSLKFDGLAIGPITRDGLADDAPKSRMQWQPQLTPSLQVGDQLIVADFAWFSKNAGNRFLNVDRPAIDTRSGPKHDCTPNSYADAPAAHAWCCRPHESIEAERADRDAERRARGEMNPQAWPPVRDLDAFEVTPEGAAVGDPAAAPPEPAPDGLTLDDVD
jgi:hypothetical protein